MGWLKVSTWEGEIPVRVTRPRRASRARSWPIIFLNLCKREGKINKRKEQISPHQRAAALFALSSLLLFLLLFFSCFLLSFPFSFFLSFFFFLFLLLGANSVPEVRNGVRTPSTSTMLGPFQAGRAAVANPRTACRAACILWSSVAQKHGEKQSSK